LLPLELLMFLLLALAFSRLLTPLGFLVLLLQALAFLILLSLHRLTVPLVLALQLCITAVSRWQIGARRFDIGRPVFASIPWGL
jgi:hypothetical protein